MTEGCAAVMQPYVFPYIGYFHLIQASSVFVFYDDVHFVKRGWINRNRILYQGTEILFTVPLLKASQNKLINEIAPSIDERWRNKFFKQLQQSYKRAPFFSEAIEAVMAPFSRNYDDVTDLSIESIATVYRYLGSEFNYTKSSVFSPETQGIDKADRLIEMTKKLGLTSYVNAPGGRSLYSKEYFQSKGVSLSFIESQSVQYDQYDQAFIPWLSIIDVLMFCPKEKVLEFFSAYSVV